MPEQRPHDTMGIMRLEVLNARRFDGTSTNRYGNKDQVQRRAIRSATEDERLMGITR